MVARGAVILVLSTIASQPASTLAIIDMKMSAFRTRSATCSVSFAPNVNVAVFALMFLMVNTSRKTYTVDATMKAIARPKMP